MTHALLVALGGAAGSLARWGVAVGLAAAGAPGPAATLLVNVVGSLGIGVLAARYAAVDPVRVALGVGVLGGFTTFSTFSLDTLELARASPLRAAAYVGATLTLGLAAAALGRSLALVR